jgi:predicted  nucleic acid-binding Zn-ribbon protein
VAVENKINKLEDDVQDLKIRMTVAENNIKDVKEDIRSIKDDIRWLRRTISGAIITAVSTGVIGGTIALFYNLLTK